MSLNRSIVINGIMGKALLAGLVAGFFLLTFFTAKWVLGNAVSSRTEFTEASEFAVSLAPHDPQTRFVHSALLSRTFDSADNALSLKELETATALSPHNFLLWLDLGKSFEGNGEPDRAVLAFRRALALAPHYSFPKWTLGNALVRQGNTEEAVPLIVAAAESDIKYADPAASLIWRIFEADPTAVNDALKAAPVISSRLIPILGREKKTGEAVAIWNTLDPAARRTSFVEVGRTLAGQLIEAKLFRQAVSVLSDISENGSSGPRAGVVLDGGFESRTPPTNASAFEWRYTSEPRMGLTDGHKRSGNYSFLVGLPAGTAAIKPLAQTIAVEPGRTYLFAIFSRSERKAGGEVRWEVVSSIDGKRLAVTEPAPTSMEWTELKATFTVPADADGIEIRLIKECPLAACSIEGNIWFDDARLDELKR